MNLRFSIVIPIRNEDKNIIKTVDSIRERLSKEAIDYEILIINDNSTDNTPQVLKKLSTECNEVRTLDSEAPHGFGLAIRKGLEEFEGDAVCIVMGDLSDSPDDIVSYYHKLNEGAECVFGSRFMAGSKISNYPKHKMLLNRFANLFIRVLFGIRFNDVTNAFKAYRREVIDGVQPILSHHFNLTVELPLKAIVRGYKYETIPISWTNRTTGVSKLKIKEMGSRYLFIVLYIFLEKLLSKGDYLRNHRQAKNPNEA